MMPETNPKLESRFFQLCMHLLHGAVGINPETGLQFLQALKVLNRARRIDELAKEVHHPHRPHHLRFGFNSGKYFAAEGKLHIRGFIEPHIFRIIHHVTHVDKQPVIKHLDVTGSSAVFQFKGTCPLGQYGHAIVDGFGGD